MNSNVAFRSNVYPVKDGFYINDETFLRNVWDYERLRYICKRVSISLPEMQEKVLREQPYCSLNKEDPCWGVIYTEEGYKWACRCTKIDCNHFEKCRALIPYDKKIDQFFVPEVKDSDEYGYEKEKNNTDFYPLITELHEEEYNYEKTSIPMQNSGLEVSITELSHKEISDPDDADTIGIDEKTEIVPYEEPESPKSGNYNNQLRETDETNLYKPIVTDNVFDLFHETDQESIITAPSDRLMFVDAGPGTGKTYTIIHKLNYMVSELEIDPDSIVVLCFTNAAVYEIRKRLREFVRNGADRGLENVDVRTFHSFAWWVIDQANHYFVDEGWEPIVLHNLNYDTSLIKAIVAMEQFGKEIFENWSHFIVDEVQDLTSERGRLVLSMINECIKQHCGITVMGDACQAIYDYEADSLSSEEFYKGIVSLFGDDAEYCFLKDNHRQTSELIALTNELRAAILSGKIESMKETTGRLLDEIEKTDKNDIPESPDVRCWLMRNNGQTLKFSSDWRKKGIGHYLNVTETPYNYSPWIADLFIDVNVPVLDEQSFLDICRKKNIDAPEEKWEHINNCLHSRNNVINVRETLNAIANSRIDDLVLRETNNDKRIVSNIHRAKGREYDEVVVDTKFIKDLANKKVDAGEYKTLYVALTRPRKALKTAVLQKNSIRRVKIFRTGRYRWGAYKNGKIQYLEFDSKGDIMPEAFLGTKNELFDVVEVGDEIILKRINSSDLKYQIIHEKSDNILGLLENSNYIKDYLCGMNLTREQYINLPESINDLYVSGVYSKVVDDKYLEENPEIMNIRPNGVWKWIEIVGVGHASYDVY